MRTLILFTLLLAGCGKATPTTEAPTERPADSAAPRVTVDELVRNFPKYKGKTVRVTGKIDHWNIAGLGREETLNVYLGDNDKACCFCPPTDHLDFVAAKGEVTIEGIPTDQPEKKKDGDVAVIMRRCKRILP